MDSNKPFSDVPFMADTTLDPFDVLEMIGVVDETKSSTLGQPPAGRSPTDSILKLPGEN